MWKKIILIISFLISLPTVTLAHKDCLYSKNVKSYTDCAKGDVQCEKEKAKGMADDRRRYEKWCREHPGRCKKKMFK